MLETPAAAPVSPLCSDLAIPFCHCHGPQTSARKKKNPSSGSHAGPLLGPRGPLLSDLLNPAQHYYSNGPALHVNKLHLYSTTATLIPHV